MDYNNYYNLFKKSMIQVYTDATFVGNIIEPTIVNVINREMMVKHDDIVEIGVEESLKQISRDELLNKTSTKLRNKFTV